jgi:predicted TIM-barrel fold metal-dependent hydrolase
MTSDTIIDAHVHTYQTREIGLQAKQGNTTTDYGGTSDELLPLMAGAGISRSVMVNMLPLADMRDAAIAKLPASISASDRDAAIKEIDARMIERLERRNSWTCQLAQEHASLIPFITLDPLMDAESMVTEITDKVNKQGARGIKLHPTVQRFFPNDHRLWPAYQAAERMGLPVIHHAGRFEGTTQYAQPKYFAEVLKTFPRLTTVVAHLGIGFVDEAVSLAQNFPNARFDCSAIISRPEDDYGLPDDDLARLIREIGVARIMFGSDFPWYDPAQGIERLLALDFSESEKRQLLGENAVRIYQLS